MLLRDYLPARVVVTARGWDTSATSSRFQPTTCPRKSLTHSCKDGHSPPCTTTCMGSRIFAPWPCKLDPERNNSRSIFEKPPFCQFQKKKIYTDNAPSSGKFGRQGFFHYLGAFPLLGALRSRPRRATATTALKIGPHGRYNASRLN